MIDGASAILSQNGGATFSVRTGYLSNMSVETPQSVFSRKSFKSPATTQNFNAFSKYRKKSNLIQSANQIFASNQSAKKSENAYGPDQNAFTFENISRFGKESKSNSVVASKQPTDYAPKSTRD